MTREISNPINEFICATIKRIRVEKGLRIQDVASRSQIPVGSYSCLEAGRYRINLENLFRIIHVLGVSIVDVWPGGVSEQAMLVDDGFIAEKIDEAEKRRPPRLTLLDVVEAVCQVYASSPEEMASPSRRRKLAEARVVATILTREQPHLSLVGLSDMLDRDVSSLSHGLRRMEDRLQNDRSLRSRLQRARRALRAKRLRIAAQHSRDRERNPSSA